MILRSWEPKPDESKQPLGETAFDSAESLNPYCLLSPHMQDMGRVIMCTFALASKQVLKASRAQKQRKLFFLKEAYDQRERWGRTKGYRRDKMDFLKKGLCSLGWERDKSKARYSQPSLKESHTFHSLGGWQPEGSCSIGLVLQPIGSTAVNEIYFKCIAVELFNSKFSWCHRQWSGSKKNEWNYFIGKRFNF